MNGSMFKADDKTYHELYVQTTPNAPTQHHAVRKHIRHKLKGYIEYSPETLK